MAKKPAPKVAASAPTKPFVVTCKWIKNGNGTKLVELNVNGTRHQYTPEEFAKVQTAIVGFE